MGGRVAARSHSRAANRAGGQGAASQAPRSAMERRSNRLHHSPRREGMGRGYASRRRRSLHHPARYPLVQRLDECRRGRRVILANPAARIRPEQGAKETERFLTRAEFDAIRAELPTTTGQSIVDVLANTGLRWSDGRSDYRTSCGPGSESPSRSREVLRRRAPGRHLPILTGVHHRRGPPVA